MIKHTIKKGLSTIYEKEVSNFDAAGSFGSGVLGFLLSTPAAITMALETAIQLLDPLLPDGYITVGKSIELQHLRPTLIGEKISLIVAVTDVIEEHVFLDIEIHDTRGLVCKGKHERFIMSSDQLIQIAYSRAEQK